MVYYYSGSTRAFYLKEINGENIPADAVPVTEAEHAALMDAQASGKIIAPDDAGRPSAIPRPSMTDAQIISTLTNVVQRHIDQTAASLGYDSAASACSYADEPAVPQFQREGKAIRAWRSLAWAKCHEIQDDVRAGRRPIPTPPELVGLLPAFVAPAA